MRSFSSLGNNVPTPSGGRRNRKEEKEGDTMQSSTLTSWNGFSSAWNQVLIREPKAAVATFLASQSTTWLALHTTMVTIGGLSAPPAVAAGWMFARVTRRFRRPINLLLAAGLYQAIPAVAYMKVTPLMGLVGPTDPQTDQLLADKKSQIETKFPVTKTIFSNISKGWEWLQGPVDKYGLALFLSGKFSYLVTMSVSAVAIHKGCDLDALLVHYLGNIGGEALGEAAGSLALSTAMNVAFVPVHFGTVVYGVPIMEEWAQKKDEEIRLYDRELQRITTGEEDEIDSTAQVKERTRTYYVEEHSQRGQEDHPQEEQQQHRSIDTLSLGLLMWATAIMLYIVRVMGKATSAAPSQEGKRDDPEPKTEEDKEEAQKA